MHRLTLLLLFALFFFSCEDRINREDMYTFKGQTAVDYISNTPDLSLFSKVIARSYNSKKSNPSCVKSLLATRGHYTIFAPTDDAIRLYLDSVYGTKNYDVDTMSREVADKIVLNTVMDNSWEKPMKTLDLYEGALNESTLNDGHIVVHYGNYAPGCT